MSTSNEKTVEAYNNHIQQYVDGTTHDVSGPIKYWLDSIVEGLPYDARIMELGSAFGRDADYLESKGFTVDRTDVTPGFVKLQKELGRSSRVLNAISDAFPDELDAIFANAVMLHFNGKEIEQVLAKSYISLRANGRLGITLKAGDGEEWSSMKLGAPRYFHYWRPESIQPVLESAGFSIVDINSSAANGTEWLQIVTKKNTKDEDNYGNI